MSVDLPSTQPWRVKVYKLEQAVWVDRGTGYCVGQFENNQPYIVVYSEEKNDEMLLKSKVYGDIQYQKQQDSLIVWADPDDNDMGLSFQEAEGCSAVCEFLVIVQNNFEHGISILAVTPAQNPTDESIMELIAGPIQYPPEPTIANLSEVVDNFNNAAATQYGRDAIVKYMHETEFIPRLVNLFSMAEDMESVDDLHNLCRIMKMLFLMNDNSVVEALLQSEHIMAVVGMLEYDPDFPRLKANHREYLSDESKFNEVVPIGDQRIRDKIRQTFWLQFLKDVVLARLLDDPTFTMLTSLIYFNQIEILQFFQKSDDYTGKLFSLYQDKDNSTLGKKRDGVRFVHQMSIVAKTFQLQQRSALYANLIKHGMFELIDFALRDELLTTRMLGTELMVTIIEQDPNLVRYSEDGTYNESVIHVFIDLLNDDKDLGLKSQASETLRVLLDVGSVELTRLGETTAAPKQDRFETMFYEKSAPRLFRRLMDPSNAEEEMKSLQGRASYEQLLDLLAFCIRQHRVPCRTFIVNGGIWKGIIQLMSTRHRQVRLAAIRAVKQGLLMDDRVYVNSIVESGAMEVVLDVLIELGNRNNLIHSSCLELLEVVDLQKLSKRRTGQRSIINYMMDNYKHKLEKLQYIEVVETMLEEPTKNKATMPEEENVNTSDDELGPTYAAFGLEYFSDDETFGNESDEGLTTKVGVKRHSNLPDKRRQRRRTESDGDSEIPGTKLRRRSSGHLKRSLVSAGKKLSVTFKRADKKKEGSSPENGG